MNLRLACLALTFGALLQAADAETAIKAVLSTQVEQWNRGDIPAFVTAYADNCIFIGKRIVEGRTQLIDRYRQTYATPEAMGRLAFSDLKVRPIDKRVAVVTGHFHLDRSAQGGGPAEGLFSLVFHLTNGAWQIVLDHTST